METGMITAFTPLASTFGGVLIGLSAVLLMWLHGRIMGATGIVSGLIFPISAGDFVWRAAVVLGMICAPLLLVFVVGFRPQIQVPGSTGMLIVGGLIVGVGVTLGRGCTSGHGVCGLARFSTRSLAATVTFMAATVLTVFVARHVLGLY